MAIMSIAIVLLAHKHKDDYNITIKKQVSKVFTGVDKCRQVWYSGAKLRKLRRNGM